MHHEYIDKFSQLDSPVHRLDPRSKIIGTLFFIGTAISIPRYEVLTLVPFLLYPAFLIVFSGIPVKYLIKHVLIVSPFILFLVIFTPFFDQTPVGEWYGILITSGMLTMLNILLKFIATVSITMILVSTTRFDLLLKGLRRLYVPRIIIIQLSFLYRYLFLLIDEAHRMKMARAARSYGRASIRLRLTSVGNIIGVLFLKTLDRAERVYAAMISRGFDGRIPTLSPLRFRTVDTGFVAGSIVLILVIRFLF